MARIQQSVGLPPEVWVQIDDLIPYFGESRGEVIGHALNVWFRSHGEEIASERARIDALRPKIEKFLQEHAERTTKPKGKKGSDSTA